MKPLSDDILLQLEPDVVFGDIDGEIVAMTMESENYLHLNNSGSFIFSLLHDGEPKRVDWLFQRTQEEYTVEEDTCRQEVSAFLNRCIELHLLQLSKLH